MMEPDLDAVDDEMTVTKMIMIATMMTIFISIMIMKCQTFIQMQLFQTPEEPAAHDKTKQLLITEDAEQKPGYQGYIEVSVEDGYEPVGRPIEETAGAATQRSHAIEGQGIALNKKVHETVGSTFERIGDVQDVSQQTVRHLVIAVSDPELHEPVGRPVEETSTETQLAIEAHSVKEQSIAPNTGEKGLVPVRWKFEEANDVSQQFQALDPDEELHEPVVWPIEETDGGIKLVKIQKVRVIVGLYEKAQTYSEEQSANMIHDIDQLKNTEQLLQALPCIRDMCLSLTLKVKSSKVMCVVYVENIDLDSLVSVLHFEINGGTIHVGKYVMFPVHFSEWNDTTRLLCKMTTECYPVFGLFQGFITAIISKICPQEILHWSMFMYISSVGFHWILVENLYLEHIIVIYDSQVNLATYEDFSDSTKEQLVFVDCPQQPKNDNSCGLHDLMFLIFKKHKKPITSNCLKNDDPYSMLHDLICLLNGDNEMTTGILTRKYYQHEYGTNETWCTYEQMKEILSPTFMEEPESTEQLQLLIGE